MGKEFEVGQTTYLMHHNRIHRCTVLLAPQKELREYNYTVKLQNNSIEDFRYAQADTLFESVDDLIKDLKFKFSEQNGL